MNRMEPGVFEWDKEARVFEESDGEDEKLTTDRRRLPRLRRHR